MRLYKYETLLVDSARVLVGRGETRGGAAAGERPAAPAGARGEDLGGGRECCGAAALRTPHTSTYPSRPHARS